MPASLLDPHRYRLWVCPGLPAQSGRLAVQRLVGLTVAGALEEPGDLGEQIRNGWGCGCYDARRRTPHRRRTGDPAKASSPGCLGLGPIGVSTDAVVFFDALDASGRDAGAYEKQDACDGHPQGQGIYHYHTYSPCLSTKASQRPGSSTLVGYTLDGYGIYLERDDHGNLPADADLDTCHGRTSAITWDGKCVVMYHYDVTLECPYTVGCYHGTRSARTRHQGGQMLGQRPSRCPAFRYLGPGGRSRTWVMSVCRARQSASGQRYGRAQCSRGPGG